MPTQIEIIRANLIGLPAEITDIVLQVLIDSSRSLHDAAIAAAESAASLAVDDSDDIKLGSLAISGGRSAQYWLDIKDNLIKRALTGEGVIIDPNEGSAYVSGYGATPSGDEIPRQLWTNQFGNPPASDPS